MSHCVRVLGISLKAVYQTSRQFDWLNSSIRKQNDCCKQHLYCPNLNRNEIVCAKQTIVDIICIVRNWKQIKLRAQNITNLCLFVRYSTCGSNIQAFLLKVSGDVHFKEGCGKNFFLNCSNKFIKYQTFVCLLVVFLSFREYFHY